MFIEGKKVILRDFIESDIDDRILWETVEKEWQDWDALWKRDEDNFNVEAYIERKIKYLSNRVDNDKLRYGFEICIRENNKHIGWINAYLTDNDYNFSHKGTNFTIGIAIPPLSERGKGYATDSWVTYIKYLIKNGIYDIYTQTWSGNFRVLGLISKLGFTEINREIECREVNKKLYDGLTFKLNIEHYKKFCDEYLSY